MIILHFTKIAETPVPGQFNMWALVDNDLHQLKLVVPRIFYVNSRTSKDIDCNGSNLKSVSKILPRATPALNLYEYRVPETIFREHSG